MGVNSARCSLTQPLLPRLEPGIFADEPEVELFPTMSWMSSTECRRIAMATMDVINHPLRRVGRLDISLYLNYVENLHNILGMNLP